jgi:NADPH-dependent curcumin reductase
VVVASQDPGVPAGTRVATYTGWQAYATTTITPAEIADPALGGSLEWISVLGTTGVTAHLEMHDIGQVRAGSSVLVSAATSAVGVVAAQLAKATARGPCASERPRPR